MKKRILSTLLALCLAVSLLPTAALAGGTETGWDAFKTAAANPSSNHLALNDYPLLHWPADAQTLTLAAQLSVQRNGTNNWDIPANITTHFAAGGAISLLNGATLTLNGPVTADEDINFRPMAVLADGRATVELNNTCYVTRSDGKLGRTYISNNYTWNVNENGALGEVYLTGKLVGKGGTVNTISVVADHGTSAGELGGTLTLTKLNVGLSDEANGILTIPEGAKITVADSATDKHDGKFYLPKGGTLYLNGELTIETGSNRFNGTIVIGENGKLILKHQYPFTKSNGEEGKITGEGTLQYVQKNTYLFENTTDSKLSDINAARGDQSYDERYDDLIAPSVKIERITSGGSGGSSTTPSTTLPAPMELTWGKHWYDDEGGTQGYFESNGMISWKYPAGVSKSDLALVRVYRVGTGENGGDEQVWHSYWEAAAGKYWTDWDFSLDGIYGETENMEEFTKADYYFTVQMVDQRKNPTKVSTEVKSGSWHYECPSTVLGTPTASVSENYVVSHTPADADNDYNGGFKVDVYRSAERITNPTIFNLFSSFMKGEADRLFAWVRYRGEPGYSDTLNIYELLAGEDPGWCYAVVYTVSSDINTVGHTGDGKVVEFYYDGDSGSGAECEHDWDQGSVTTPPTLEREGVKTFTCGKCTETKTEPMAKLQEQEVGWTANTITWTYGQVGQVINTAYNETEGGGALRYTSSNTNVATVDESGKVTIVGAGTVTITATAAAVGYQYAATSAEYTLTVEKAPLTIAAKNKTISYGKNPTNDGYEVSGLVNGDSESILTGTVVYAYNYEQFGKVGTYEISLTGLSAKNYDITFNPGTLTVAKATDYSITLGKLEQVAGHTSAVTASITPYDSTARFKVEYQVGESWTETVPMESGSYAVRASLTASDNITIKADNYGSGTLVVKGGVTVDGASATETTVTVDNGKATLDIAKPDEMAESASGDVTIDIGGVSGAKELGLPAGLLTGLSENADAGSLTVTTEDASVKLSSAVLDTVADAVREDGDSVTVRLTTVEKNALNDQQQAALESIGGNAVIVEVKLVIAHAGGGETELHELGGETEITVPYDGPVPTGKYIVVSYVSNDGSVSYVRATYNAETRQVSFKTNHFSHYVVALSSQRTFNVTVTNGSGSGAYLAGSTVTITAERRNGYAFTGWTVISGTVTLSDSTAAQTTFAMPESDVALRADYTAISYIPVIPAAKPSQPTQPPAVFTDVAAGSYYEAAVRWAVEKKITTGVTTTLFAPEERCTRAQIVTFLWRAAGCPESTITANFSDVSGDAYCAKAIAWAVENGITTGIGDGKFAPDDTCTRAQSVTFLYRASGSPAFSGSTAFSDVAADAYYAGAVAWAAASGVTSGIGSGLFGGDGVCTRGQIVTMLYRLLAE